MTALNTSLQVVATGLVALGATSIQTNLISGAVEIVLGILVYIIYEKLPPSNPS